MGKPRHERREEIVRSALELAASRGVKRVTTQAIADRVGIAQPTVFRHFKTRDEIFSAAIAWLAKHLFEALEPTLNNEATPADRRLHALLETQLSFVASHKGLPRVLFSDRLHLESPILKKAVREVMERYIETVAGLIRDGIDSGCFDPGLDARVSAELIAATVQGLVMRWSIHDFDFPIEEQAGPLWRHLRSALTCPTQTIP